MHQPERSEWVRLQDPELNGDSTVAAELIFHTHRALHNSLHVYHRVRFFLVAAKGAMYDILIIGCPRSSALLHQTAETIAHGGWEGGAKLSHVRTMHSSFSAFQYSM